jgi:hypothetical protein
MKIKKIQFLISIYLSLYISGFSQIPVTDVANINQGFFAALKADASAWAISMKADATAWAISAKQDVAHITKETKDMARYVAAEAKRAAEVAATIIQIKVIYDFLGNPGSVLKNLSMEDLAAICTTVGAVSGPGATGDLAFQSAEMFMGGADLRDELFNLQDQFKRLDKTVKDFDKPRKVSLYELLGAVEGVAGTTRSRIEALQKERTKLIGKIQAQQMMYGMVNNVAWRQICKDKIDGYNVQLATLDSRLATLIAESEFQQNSIYRYYAVDETMRYEDLSAVWEDRKARRNKDSEDAYRAYVSNQVKFGTNANGSFGDNSPGFQKVNWSDSLGRAK